MDAALAEQLAGASLLDGGASSSSSPARVRPALGVQTDGLRSAGGALDAGDAERLIVRLDQPLENVEFAAHTLLRGTDGGVLTPTSRKIKFRWLRSRACRSCAWRECPTPRRAASLESLLSQRRYCCKACMEGDFRAETRRALRRVQPQLLSAEQCPSEPAPAALASGGGGGGGADPWDEDRRSCWRVRPFDEPDEWEVVGEHKSYTPGPQDVGHVLKVQCTVVGADGATLGAVQEKETPVVIGVDSVGNDRLLRRAQWLSSGVRRKHSVANFLKSEGGGAVLRVMSYNLLAEVYATKQLFPYCPLWALNWGYRRQLILKELQRHSADVICLQECQADHYEGFLLPRLQRLGYEGIYKAKTREAMGRKGKIDGVAILYRRARLRLLDTQEVEYNTIALEEAKQGHYALAELSPAENERRTERILKRLCKDNVGLITMFETVPEGFDDNPALSAAARATGPQQICVATTHMFWDPEFADVKYIQTYSLLQELAHIVGAETPLILTGDFNSTPDSAVVEYLSEDQVNENHADFATDPFHLLEDVHLTSHNLQLASAYDLVTGSPPHSTNYTAHFSGVLDYIWLSTNSLTPLSVLAIPDEKALRGEDDTFMPNANFPSDHISLCVDININPRERVRSRPGTPSPPSPGSPPMTPGFEHLQQLHYFRQQQQQQQQVAQVPPQVAQQQQQQQHHHPHAGSIHAQRVLSQQQQQQQGKGMQHSPNPAMLGAAYHLQQQMDQQQRNHSPALHPLSQQQQQQFLQQQRLF